MQSIFVWWSSAVPNRFSFLAVPVVRDSPQHPFPFPRYWGAVRIHELRFNVLRARIFCCCSQTHLLSYVPAGLRKSGHFCLEVQLLCQECTQTVLGQVSSLSQTKPSWVCLCSTRISCGRWQNCRRFQPLDEMNTVLGLG